MFVIVAGRPASEPPRHLWLEGEVGEARDLAELYDEALNLCDMLAAALAEGDTFDKTEIYDAGSKILGMCICGAWPGDCHFLGENPDCPRHPGGLPATFWGRWAVYGFDPRQPDVITPAVWRVPWAVLGVVMDAVRDLFGALVGDDAVLYATASPDDVRAAREVFRLVVEMSMMGHPWGEEDACAS